MELLYEALLKHCPPNRCLVGIEGHSTSGKSTLGKKLALLSGESLFSTDEYARQRKKNDAYPDLVDVERLKRDVKAVSGRSLSFIEGICLRDVLESAGLKPDVFVYIKRITQAGLWADDPENYVSNGKPNSGLSWVDGQSVRCLLSSIRQSQTSNC